MLLIIDDAWDIQSGKAMRCGGPNCCHLLTTRNQAIARQFAGATRVEPVRELSRDAAYTLLQQLAPGVCAAFPQETRALADGLGGLPLAIELLGGYLGHSKQHYFKEQQQSSLETMSKPEERLALAGKRLGDAKNRQQTLEQAIGLSLEDLDETTRNAFYALGAFAPKPEQFDRPAAEAVTGANMDTLATLLDRNLLDIDDEEQLSIHQVLADVACTRLVPEAVKKHRDHYLLVVNEDRTAWERVRDTYAQLNWAAQAVKDDVAFLECLWAVRRYLELQGLWQDAFAWYEQALSVVVDAEEEKDEGTILNNIGRIHDTLGDKTQALDYLEQALVIHQKVGNRTVESVTRYNMAMIHHGQGDTEKAIHELTQAVELERQIQHPDYEQDLALLERWKAEQ